MLHTIHNDHLTVTVNSRGAELWSIRNAKGTEFLWQGDEAFWTGRSPNLFPYIGRMIGKRYEHQGMTYPMEIHGIVLYSALELVEKTDTKMVFALESSAESLKQYPWEFLYRVNYSLSGNRLEITYEVTNRSGSAMLFAVGGHPGFHIPAEEFESYSLRFSEKCEPERILFTPDCFVEDHTAPYPLKNGTDIPLHHDLFREDAIVLKNTPKSVTLTNDKDRSITVTFPQMEHIGFWHATDLPCPYVCIEPWSSLPSPKGEKTVLDTQEDLLKLAPGKCYENTWSITID